MKQDPRALTGKKRKRTPSLRQHLPKPSGPIQLLRMRVTTDESLLVKAREQLNQAKRRRKLAKLLAKRARKGVKQAKANLAEARAALARAEATLLANKNRPAAKRKTRRTKPVNRAAAPPVKKRSAAPRKRRSLSRGTLLAPIEPPTPVTLDTGTGPSPATPAPTSLQVGDDNSNLQPI